MHLHHLVKHLIRTHVVQANQADERPVHLLVLPSSGRPSTSDSQRLQDDSLVCRIARNYTLMGILISNAEHCGSVHQPLLDSFRNLLGDPLKVLLGQQLIGQIIVINNLALAKRIAWILG